MRARGSDGHLNVCGLVKKKPSPIGSWQMPCKRPAIQANKNQQEKTQPPNQTKQTNQHHGCTQVTAAVLLKEIELPEASYFQVAKDGIRSKCKHLHAKEAMPVLTSCSWTAKKKPLNNRTVFRASCMARTSLLPLHRVIPHISLLLSPIYPVLGVPYLSYTLLLPANPFP